jgi:hypothetical protein
MGVCVDFVSPRPGVRMILYDLVGATAAAAVDANLRQLVKARCCMTYAGYCAAHTGLSCFPGETVRTKHVEGG